MDRRRFIRQSAWATAGILAAPGFAKAATATFPTVRIPNGQRKFKSEAVEALIREIKNSIGNKELAYLFENCFPNTLDTTVDFTNKNGRPDTYVITGDIDAMWLRDSSAQVFPYIALCKADKPLQQLIKGVINRQSAYVRKDPYANAFYKDPTKVSEWKNDVTAMQPGIHERKWEVDSLCYPIRLAYHYFKATADRSPFDAEWLEMAKTIVRTFREQQRMGGKGPYSFKRMTEYATDSVPLDGYGYPVRPNGMICSMFRPSDDATIFPYLIPSNFFARHSLQQMEELVAELYIATDLLADIRALQSEVRGALNRLATAPSERYGAVYAYETNGMGSYNLMDDANVPSLLSLPYLIPDMAIDPIYHNTRKLVLSEDNPFFFKGKAAEGIGGPHAGMDRIWPLGIIMRGITAETPSEVHQCLDMLQATHAGTGFMHESFHKDDAATYSRPWFAWANTLFGEFVRKVYLERPELLG